jgi:hypothetical protein
VTSHLVGELVQVSLLATSGHASLAAGLLVDRFGLSRQQAERLLDLGYGIVSPRMAYHEAADAIPLLTAMGLRLQIMPAGSDAPQGNRAVSVHLREPKHAQKVLDLLQDGFGLHEVRCNHFGGPEGLVICDLSPQRALEMSRALRRMPGVSHAVADMQAAVYDLFAAEDLDEATYDAIRQELRLLGCGTGRFGDAIGLGLEPLARDRILGQFSDLGLFAVNRTFQRYELLVIGKGALSHQDFSDFMATRPAAKSIAPRNLIRALPLPLESWLTRTAATQFLTDYRSIGIHADVRLMSGAALAELNR